MKNRNHRIMDEEEKYYSLLKKYARISAPFYDTVTAFMSGLRDKVVEFTNARKGSKILDVCTGTGKQAFAFARRGYDIIGVDLSEDMLKVANKKNKYRNVRFQVADTTNLPFEDNSFDVSFVSFALHDMILPIRERALKEIVRVTKFKGTIVVVDYALPKNNITRFVVYHFVKLYEPYYPEFIKSDLEALLKKSGIEIEEKVSVFLGAARIIKGTRRVGVEAGTQYRDSTLFSHEPKHEFKGAAYIPAFSYGFLTPFYDFMMKWTMREAFFKRQLVEQASIRKGHRVLDLGCGTGTLTILIKRLHHEAGVIGVDADLQVLGIARSKIAKVGLDISLNHGTAFDLPYPDDFFDRVASSMVFHHLNRENKIRSLKESFRVLKPGGELHIADFRGPQNALTYLASLIVGRLEENWDNVRGILPDMIRVVGFDWVQERARYTTLFGTVVLYAARKPLTN